MAVQVLVASRNRKKLGELERVLAAAGIEGIELLTLRDVDEYPETPETGATFEDNALIKARDGVRYAGLPTVADDSGITVDALNGMPGVLSARWSGSHGDDEANNALLLAQLSDIADAHRGARFVCAAALVSPDGREIVLRGEMTGRLLTAGRGEGGFGYDPLFVPDGETRTSAELTAAEKDAISHRGKAFRAIAGHVAELLES